MSSVQNSNSTRSGYQSFEIKSININNIIKTYNDIKDAFVYLHSDKKLFKPLDIFKHYNPINPAIEVHKSSCKNLVLLCGMQSGKSTTCAAEFLKRISFDRMMKFGDLRYWCVAPTYALTRRQEELVRSLLKQLNCEYENKESERIYYLPENVTIQFKSADNEYNLVAEPIDGIWIDESARLKSKAWLESLESRTIATNGWNIHSTTSLGRNWFYNELIKKCFDDDTKHNYKFITWKTEDNNSIKDIKLYLEAKRKTISLEHYKRLYEASIDDFSGKIYNEFKYDLHVKSFHYSQLKNKIIKVLYGYDPGFNEGAITVSYLCNDKHIYLVHEHIQKDMRENDILSFFKHAYSTFGIGDIYVDKANQGVISLLKDNHFNVYQSDSSVNSGILLVKTLLNCILGDNLPIFIINANCGTFINNLLAYKWKDDKEKPVKENDHSLDAFRYSVYHKLVKDLIKLIESQIINNNKLSLEGIK